MISHNHTIAPTVGADHEPVRPCDWRARAACVGHDPELWFPVGPGNGAEPDCSAALAICARCPVWAECLEDAVANKDAWGVRGERTPHELKCLITGDLCVDCGAEPPLFNYSRCAPCREAYLIERPLKRKHRSDPRKPKPCAQCGDVRWIRGHGLCKDCLRAERTAS